ncbi:uncharacterized protein F5147DRAFT_779487 [Suillus discolor]|uniref:Uncharacterized protein n=1 Tax=Suillus discolor TaxID=1912936 RepID=A0A9P7EVC1_9AGAM|nr:uncharacterized protein F5147DRAFT_779487 [Suillus discolor]KAG2092924.1 hypothetical protein F5147DRAFT_779487 [Suillus discolor]
MDEDDDMVIVGDNDVHDDDGNEDHEHSQANKNEEHEDEDEDFVCAKTSPDDIEGDSDNGAKATDEEPEDDENNEDLRCAKTSPGDFGPETSYTFSQAKREGPATSDQVYAYKSDGNEDPDHDHNSPPSPPTKRRKTSSAVKTTSANTSQDTTCSTTICTKHAHTSILHSSDNPTPAGIVFGPTPDNDPSEDEQELPGHLKRGRLCQEGINEAQELGWTTVEEAWVIGAKYGKSARSILIEAGLSIKHSWSESDWNAHQCWFMDNNLHKDKESIIDWKERQCKHYHAMGKEDGQWDTIHDYNITGGNTNQSRAKTILSMREDIARKLSAYSHLEGVEAVSCIFDTTQDEAAQQASSIVVGSDLISERLQHICAAVYGGVGAYEILLSKPNEPPRDHYRRIWPIMVLENTFQWRKLLDYAFQYKFMIKNWPDNVPPIGPEFNPHYLSSQHLKLLIIPFIKRKVHLYYEAELQTEAENLFELEKKKSKGKHRAQDHTVEDIMSKLDVTVPEIEFAAWPDDCLKQLQDKVPEMLDIPLVTSTLDVVLCKLVDSAKFKLSIPEDMLAVNEAHSDAPIPSTQEMLPRDHEPPVTLSPPTLPSNQRHSVNITPVHRREGSHPTRVPDVLDRESRPALPIRREEPTGGGKQQTSLPFKAKKISWADPTLARCMEERPPHSHNGTDLECEPYHCREDRNFAAPNRRREYSRSPPVYPERDEHSHTRYYRPIYRQCESSPFADDEDYSYPPHHTYSHRPNQADDNSQRFQVRETGDSYREDGPLQFRY